MSEEVEIDDVHSFMLEKMIDGSETDTKEAIESLIYQAYQAHKQHEEIEQQMDELM